MYGFDLHRLGLHRFGLQKLSCSESREPGLPGSGNFENKRKGAGAQCKLQSPVALTGVTFRVRVDEYAARVATRAWRSRFAPDLGLGSNGLVPKWSVQRCPWVSETLGVEALNRSYPELEKFFLQVSVAGE